MNAGRSAFRLELATAADDAEIRRLLAENPVPGRISVAYRREPDFFLGCGPLGPFCQTLVARHSPSGRLAGLACRSSRPLYINGREQTVGYLGQLRVAAEFRGRWLLAAGFRSLRRLHEDGRAPFYLTTIIEGNREAEGVLVNRPRRHFPSYRPLARLHTLALATGRYRSRPSSGSEIRSGAQVGLEPLLRFWAAAGAERQFFPVWNAADFAPGAAAARGLELEEVLVALGPEGIVGTLALWDQSSYKQAQVCGYAPPLGALRPLYNLLARSAGRPPLPPVGAQLATVSGAMLCIREGRGEVFSALLDAALARAAERRRDWLLLGLCDGDPFLDLARRRRHVLYRSTLYRVAWEEDAPLEPLDGRPVHVELATL